MKLCLIKYVKFFYIVNIFKKGIIYIENVIILGQMDGMGWNIYCVIFVLRNVILDFDLVGKFYV